MVCVCVKEYRGLESQQELRCSLLSASSSGTISSNSSSSGRWLGLLFKRKKKKRGSENYFDEGRLVRFFFILKRNLTRTRYYRHTHLYWPRIYTSAAFQLFFSSSFPSRPFRYGRQPPVHIISHDHRLFYSSMIRRGICLRSHRHGREFFF